MRIPRGPHCTSAEHWLSSTDRRNSLAEHFGWFHPIQGLSRAVVELPGDGIQVGGTVQAQVSFAWEVLAEEAIGVFVASPLPWAVRVAEVDQHVRVRAEPHVFSHLLALIPRQRPAQLGGQLGDLARQCGTNVLRSPTVRQV